MSAIDKQRLKTTHLVQAMQNIKSLGWEREIKDTAKITSLYTPTPSFIPQMQLHTRDKIKLRDLQRCSCVVKTSKDIYRRNKFLHFRLLATASLRCR